MNDGAAKAASREDDIVEDRGSTAPSAAAPVYGRAARRLHWITVAGVFTMLPLGLLMTYRGNTMEVWDGLTNALYSTHKLLGFLLLWLAAGRLAWRLLHGAPPDEPGLSRLQKAASHLVHWLLYGLLLIVPLLGWIGVSLFPSLSIFGLFDLPGLVSPNEEAAKRVLDLHGTLALAMGLVIAGHVAAALYHHLIRKDGVLRRMLPGLR